MNESTSDRYEVNRITYGLYEGWWNVIDTETGNPVRPSAADAFEIEFEEVADHFADLMNERDARLRNG